MKPMETPLDTIISLVSCINKTGEKFFNFTPSQNKASSKLSTLGLKTSSLDFEIMRSDDIRYLSIYLGLIDKYIHENMDKT